MQSWKSNGEGWQKLGKLRFAHFRCTPRIELNEAMNPNVIWKLQEGT
jgi:hypothetical protein